MNTTNNRTTITRCQDVFLHSHQNLGFRTCFFRLDDVKVHLVTVEVSVVRRTNCEVETESVTFHNSDFVDHHRHSVKRWLSVEDGNIPIDEVALDLHTRLRVSTDVNGRKSVFDRGWHFVVIFWAATVWTADFKMLWEWLRIRVVGLRKLVHPSVMEDCTWVVFW